MSIADAERLVEAVEHHLLDPTDHQATVTLETALFAVLSDKEAREFQQARLRYLDKLADRDAGG